MILNLSVELTEERASVGVVRHLLRYLLEKEGVVEDDITDVETLVGELANNAVVHAPQEGFRVDFALEGGRAILTVADGGDGFSPREVPPPGSVRQDEGGEPRYGGFGLVIVQSLADRVEFQAREPHGMAVRAEKALRRTVPPADAVRRP